MIKRILFIGVFTILLPFFLPNISFAQDGSEIGVSTGDDCLRGMGKDCFKYETIIGIKDYQKTKYTAKSIAQDVIYAATYMVGTILTIAIIYCGLRYIFASASGKDPKEYGKRLVKAAIGALLVWGAYAIVRLIQYLAKG